MPSEHPRETFDDRFARLLNQVVDEFEDFMSDLRLVDDTAPTTTPIYED